MSDSKGAAIEEALEDLIIDKIGQNYIETNLKGTVYVVGADGLVEAILALLAQEVKPDKVDRFEVIDDTGRAYVKGSIYGSPVSVELSYQDDGRTLKVFVSDRKAGLV